MLKKKFIVWMLIFATVAMAVETESCYVSEACTIEWGHFVNSSNTSQILLGQNCNITIYDNASTLVLSALMTNDTYGWHTHMWNNSTSGTYPYTILCELGTEGTVVAGLVDMRFRDMFNFIPIVLMLFAGGFLALSYLMKEDKMFQTLFTFMAIGTFMITSFVLINYSDSTQIDNALNAFFAMTISGATFVLLYYLIITGLNTVDWWDDKKKKREKEEGMLG